MDSQSDAKKWVQTHRAPRAEALRRALQTLRSGDELPDDEMTDAELTAVQMTADEKVCVLGEALSLAARGLRSRRVLNIKLTADERAGTAVMTADKRDAVLREAQCIAFRMLRSRVKRTDELAAAVLEAIRRESLEDLAELLDALDIHFAERCLTSAWCQAQALHWPMSEKTEQNVLRNLLTYRTDICKNIFNSPVPPEAPLWDRVDQLVVTVERLLVLLDTLAEAGEAGEADEAVTLAMCTALAVRDVKKNLRRTYGEVPWEEIEFLLALFVEAHTVFKTPAYVVASAERVGTHLRFFLHEVKQLDREVTPEDLREAPRGERVEWVEKVSKAADLEPGMAGIVEDFALLRDWHSLSDILEALKVALDALALPRQDWEDWGWLALRRALFVAGEKAKNSWESPNLSTRYATLIEALSPEGVLNLLRKGRDDQAHSKVIGNVGAQDHDSLKGDLQRLLVSCKYIFGEAVVDVIRRAGPARSYAEYMGPMHFVFAIDLQIGAVCEQVMSLLKEDHEIYKNYVKVNETYDHNIKILADALKEYFFSISYEWLNIESEERSKRVMREQKTVELLCKEYFPHLAPRVHKLMYFKGAEGLSSFQTDMKEQRKDNHLEAVSGDVSERAVTALRKLYRFFEIQTILQRYAVEGALQVLADNWQNDRAALPLEPRAPALFGRQLRNHLHHGDLTVHVCFNAELELMLLGALIAKDNINLRLGNGQPPLRNTGKSLEEQMRLSRLKDEMFRAARRGDLDGLQRAAEAGVDVSCADCRGRTLLHAAAEAGQDGVLDWLLDCGAVNPLAEDCMGCTALHKAANALVAEKLLAATADGRDDLRLDCDALLPSAFSGRTDVLQVLLSRFDPNANPNADPSPFARAFLDRERLPPSVLLDGLDVNPTATVLTYAALGGSTASLTLLLRQPPPHLGRCSDNHCWLAACAALNHGHERAASVLIGELRERGAQLNEVARRVVLRLLQCRGTAVTDELLDAWPEAVSVKYEEGRYELLHYAAIFGRADLVRTVLRRGADPLRRDREKFAEVLNAAAVGGSVDVINALWELVQEEAERPGEMAKELWKSVAATALETAASYGHLEAVKRLVELGADMDAGTTDYTPLLDAAAGGGHAPVVEWLLGKGAKVHSYGERTVTPLHRAAKYGHVAVADLLVPKGTNVKPGVRRARLETLQAVDDDGLTALHWAMLSGSRSMVELLLDRERRLLEVQCANKKAGQSSEVKNLSVYRGDGEGLTPLFVGVVFGAPSIVLRVLLKHMEDERVMELGRKDAKEVLGMVMAALRIRIIKLRAGISFQDRAAKELIEACHRLSHRTATEG